MSINDRNAVELVRPRSAEHPFDRVIHALRAAGCQVRLTGSDRARAHCPTHRDVRPSLAVTRKDDRVLLKCFAGCRFGDICRGLNLKQADLFSGPTRRDQTSRVVATYDYVDLHGEVVATKVRFEPK